MKVVVTGASGSLGSQVFKAFKQNNHDVKGLAYSRANDELIKIDLTNEDEVVAFLGAYRPDWVIHCAAQTLPDVAEKDPIGTRLLNVHVPGQLALLAKRFKFKLVYISTNYVFDGTSPPYTPSSRTNPLQLYGQTKRDGEVAVLAVDGAQTIVFRIPILYGPVPKNSDLSVNVLLDIVQDQSGTTYTMDHYATRYPTNIIDIANFLVRLTTFKKIIPPILHYGGDEPFTKYEMCLVFAKILGFPHKHIVPNVDPPTGGTSRPRNCHLYTRETEDLDVEGGLGLCLFEEWWTQYLKQ